jgi:hypothetical protein
MENEKIRKIRKELIDYCLTQDSITLDQMEDIYQIIEINLQIQSIN